MTDTTHLGLTYIDAAQAQKHVTLNEALAKLDALVHLAVSARGVLAPPSTPAEGDRVLIGANATGAFAGKDAQIATFLAGDWIFLPPRPGWRLFVASETLLLLYDGANWADLGVGLRALQNLTRLSVGTTADATNPFAVKANAALFTARAAAEGGSDDMRLSFNKGSAGRTVSQVYETNYSGRAETGLTGDDNFHVKVSADGAAWRESIVIDRNSGAVSFPSGGPTTLQAFRASGVYTPTPGMRFAEVVLFGGGGGGGSGARQAAGATAAGGGGGGGGGVARERFSAAQVGVSQTITIGAGGGGGAPQLANSAAGANGAAGGDTSFGALLTAFGGGAGAGGALAAPSGGGAGSSPFAKGGNASTGVGGVGVAGQGAGGVATAGASATLPGFGSGGGGGPVGAIGADGGASFSGGSGGGGGGGLSAANAPADGGQGGSVFASGLERRGARGLAAGAIGGASGPGDFATTTGPLTQAGGGGGGGAAGTSKAGGGGAGGFPGGGGGGGGASQNGATSGAGGVGAAGYALIIEFF